MCLMRTFKVLHLTGKNEGIPDPVADVVRKNDDIYIRHTDKFEYLSKTMLRGIDFIIKDRYPHSVPNLAFENGPPIIGFIPALLPYNRGVHSVLWSIYDKTPIGGTIFRFYSADYDVGILSLLECKPDYKLDTLRTLYDKIFNCIYNEFDFNYTKWRPSFISSKRISDYSNNPLRTLHDSNILLSKLKHGIDTPIKDICSIIL